MSPKENEIQNIRNKEKRITVFIFQTIFLTTKTLHNHCKTLINCRVTKLENISDLCS